MLWLWILLIVLAVLLAALLGAAWYFFQFSILRRKEERTDEEYELPDSIWHGWAEQMKEAQTWLREHTAEHPSITSFDGLKLSALYIPSELERPKGTLIAFHGYRSLATIDFALEAKFLHDLGYRLLLPYQRSHGESQGKYITYGVKERFDCRDWANYARQRFGEEDIFLLGISMGASTVLMAAGTDLPETVRGIVGDCGFTSPWDIMRHVSQRDFKLPSFPLMNLLDLLAKRLAGFSLKGADTRKALGASTLPVLFLHGAADDFVPVYMTQENTRACAGEKELYLVPGAGHAQSFSTDPQGCGDRMARFFQRHASRNF